MAEQTGNLKAETMRGDRRTDGGCQMSEISGVLDSSQKGVGD